MNDTLRYYDFKTDTLKKQIETTSYEDSDEKHLLKYELIGTDHLLLVGKWGGDSLRVRLRKKDVKDFPLVKTGFNWINEYPNNR